MRQVSNMFRTRFVLVSVWLFLWLRDIRRVVIDEGHHDFNRQIIELNGPWAMVHNKVFNCMKKDQMAIYEPDAMVHSNSW